MNSFNDIFYDSQSLELKVFFHLLATVNSYAEQNIKRNFEQTYCIY